MYLSEDEFRIFAQLSAKQLSKTRYSVPPFGIDVFEGTLQGLIVAEAEFESAQDADSLTLPSFIVREVSADPRFTGGRLVRASRQEIQAWLSEYGIKLPS
jgi:CYTH domain-containing protein